MKNLAIMVDFNADLMMTRDSGLLFFGPPCTHVSDSYFLVTV